jgi:hypothetical protein
VKFLRGFNRCTGKSACATGGGRLSGLTGIEPFLVVQGFSPAIFASVIIESSANAPWSSPSLRAKSPKTWRARSNNDSGEGSFHGVFVTAGPDPTEDELVEAQRRLDEFHRKLVAAADLEWERWHNPMFITDLDRRAAKRVEGFAIDAAITAVAACASHRRR